MTGKKATKKPAGKKKGPAREKSELIPMGFSGSAWGMPYQDEDGRTLIDHFTHGIKDREVVLSIPPELLEKELASYPAPPEIPEGYVIIGEFEAPAGSVITIPPEFDLREDDQIRSSLIQGESAVDGPRIKVVVLRREEDPQGGQGEAIEKKDDRYVDPKVEVLKAAVSEARSFASLGNSLIEQYKRSKYNAFGTALSGAVRRRSLDLTRVLAKYRRS